MTLVGFMKAEGFVRKQLLAHGEYGGKKSESDRSVSFLSQVALCLLRNNNSKWEQFRWDLLQ